MITDEKFRKYLTKFIRNISDSCLIERFDCTVHITETTISLYTNTAMSSYLIGDILYKDSFQSLVGDLKENNIEEHVYDYIEAQALIGM